MPEYYACPASATCVLMSPPVFTALTVEDGAQLGFSIVGVWAVAWGFRVLARALMTSAQADKED